MENIKLVYAYNYQAFVIICECLHINSHKTKYVRFGDVNDLRDKSRGLPDESIYPAWVVESGLHR